MTSTIDSRVRSLYRRLEVVNDRKLSVLESLERIEKLKIEAHEKLEACLEEIDDLTDEIEALKGEI